MTTTHRPAPSQSGHDWRSAGEAWGHAATDWACLYEHYAFDVLLAMFPRLGVGPDTELLDIACGSGLAVRLAGGMGATVAGIDAADALIAVARAAYAGRRPPPRIDVRAALGRRIVRRRDLGQRDLGWLRGSARRRRSGCCDREDGSVSASGARARRSTSVSSSACSRSTRPTRTAPRCADSTTSACPASPSTMVTAAGFEVRRTRRAHVGDRMARRRPRLACALQPGPGRPGAAARRHRGAPPRGARCARALPRRDRDLPEPE